MFILKASKDNYEHEEMQLRLFLIKYFLKTNI